MMINTKPFNKMHAINEDSDVIEIIVNNSNSNNEIKKIRKRFINQLTKPKINFNRNLNYSSD